MIDFSGLNTAKEVVKHLKDIKIYVILIPVGILCFIIKYERYDLIQK